MFLLAGDAVLQVFFKVPLTLGCLDEQILCQLQETQSGGVTPFKCWRLEVVGDHLMRAVWGMAPNNGVKINQN
jgi:hypothetical protein